MIELFSDIPIEIKQFYIQIINNLFKKENPFEVTQTIKELIKISNNSKRLEEFINFYFSLKLEELSNENNND